MRTTSRQTKPSGHSNVRPAPPHLSVQKGCERLTSDMSKLQYQSVSWFGLIGPRGLPQALVKKLNADTVKVLKEPATQHKFALQGAVPDFGTPEHFAKLQRDEYAELGALIKQIGMKPQ